MDVVETWSETGAEGLTFKHIEEFEIRFRVFDRNHVCIKSLDGPEDVVEIRLSSVTRKGDYIAKMAVDLSYISNRSGGETEGVDCPVKVGIPLTSAKRTTFTQSRF